MTGTIPADPLDLRILDALQQEIPLVSRPWEAIADRLGISENEVIVRLKKLTSSGIIRGISPVLESRSLGLNAATLVALRVPEGKLGKVAEIISRYPEVSHNFRRDHEYALWFTVTARDRAAVDRVLARILKETGIPASDALDLPTIRKIKIDVRFPFQPEAPGTG